MYTISPKKVGYPLFSRLQKWICRASQVLMEDGKSVEEKFTDVAEDIDPVEMEVMEHEN
jgi:hypothetical protein